MYDGFGLVRHEALTWWAPIWHEKGMHESSMRLERGDVALLWLYLSNRRCSGLCFETCGSCIGGVGDVEYVVGDRVLAEVEHVPHDRLDAITTSDVVTPMWHEAVLAHGCSAARRSTKWSGSRVRFSPSQRRSGGPSSLRSLSATGTTIRRPPRDISSQWHLGRHLRPSLSPPPPRFNAMSFRSSACMHAHLSV